ncbi:hypothetical protein DGMP_16990 [Desulfomarina profundi]|uniref:ABC transporter domain-containing protein n=1 Tax=Desulfomarina profundi TaxID=2772557 RepID=A0A8D5FI20_9BACT|nr:ABC transporter ATP-binding protein [Desulfomarina profundi]BCL61006.1 hypothetical protein DGMP_16990 [Desulfomarina profundi]
MAQALIIKNLTKQFAISKRKINTVLSNLSLEVDEGDVFGFLGPNGAGKSTTIKLILNFLRPTSGEIEIFGNIVGKNEFRHQIGYLSESPVFYNHLTAWETLLLSGKLSNLQLKELKKTIPVLLERLNLQDAINIRVRDFSKGMKQRLGMANALIHDPQIFIFDEPMSGLDPLGRHLIKEIFEELKKRGKTIFFSTHILSDIEELCDRIAVIHKGELLYSGELSNFVEQQTLEEQFVSSIKEAENAKQS